MAGTTNGGWLDRRSGATYGEVADRRKEECVWLDQLVPGRPEYRVHMRCPRCCRHVEWKHERTVKVLTQFHAAGFRQLDISQV